MVSRRALLHLAGAAFVARRLPAFATTQGPLILGAGGVERARQALAAHPLGADILRRVTKRAEDLLALPPKEREYEPGRAVTLPTSREVLERVQTLGAAFFFTDNQRFADRGIAEIVYAAVQSEWNPAHFLDTAEMATAVALGFDWFRTRMSGELRHAVIAGLIRNAVEPAFAEHARGTFWTKSTHNWNIVCNGGMTVAALALASDAPEQSKRLLDLSLESVRSGFSSFAPDGGCVEGPAYWDYGTRYASYLLAALDSAGVDDRGLAASPGFAQTGRFFLHATGPSGKLFNFADAAETTRRSPHRFWLAQRFNRPGDTGAELAREGSIRAMHALWFPERVVTPGQGGEPLDAVFRGIDVAMFRSAWDDPKAIYLACKGGNNVANHAHLDLGTFVLDAGGERFAVDLGPDDYALPGYFDKTKRFSYYRLGSAGQNVLAVNGANQQVAAAAPFEFSRSSPGFACAVANLSRAYPGTDHRRGFALVDRAWAIIADEVVPSAPSELLWQMHTRAGIEIKGKRAVLQQGSAILHAHIVEPAGVEFSIEISSPPAPENSNKGVRRLVVRLGRRDKPLRLTIAFGLAEAVPPKVADRARQPLARWTSLT